MPPTVCSPGLARLARPVPTLWPHSLGQPCQPPLRMAYVVPGGERTRARFALLAVGGSPPTTEPTLSHSACDSCVCLVGGSLSWLQVRARRGPLRRYLPGAGPDRSCGCFRGPSSMKLRRHRSTTSARKSIRSHLEDRLRPPRRPVCDLSCRACFRCAPSGLPARWPLPPTACRCFVRPLVYFASWQTFLIRASKF